MATFGKLFWVQKLLIKSPPLIKIQLTVKLMIQGHVGDIQVIYLWVSAIVDCLSLGHEKATYLSSNVSTPHRSAPTEIPLEVMPQHLGLSHL